MNIAKTTGRVGTALRLGLLAALALGSQAAFSQDHSERKKAAIQYLNDYFELRPPTKLFIEDEAKTGFEYAIQEDYETHRATNRRGTVNYALMIDSDMMMYEVTAIPYKGDRSGRDAAWLACADVIRDQIPDDAKTGLLNDDNMFEAKGFMNHDLVKSGPNYVFKSSASGGPAWVCDPETLSIKFKP